MSLLNYTGFSQVSINNMEKLQSIAQTQSLQKVIEEANRSLTEFKTLHPNYDLSAYDVQELIEKLRESDYFSSKIYYESDTHKISFSEGLFKGSGLEESKPVDLSQISISKELIETVLVQSKNTGLQIFVLDYVNQSSLEISVLALLTAYLQNENQIMRDRLITLMKAKQVISKAPYYAAISELNNYEIQKSILRLSVNSKAVSRRCDGHYLGYLFSNYRASIDARTVMACLDRGYPQQFTDHLFKSYPKDLAHAFIKPFREGYGRHFRTLLNAFTALMSAENANDKQIMDAMKYALINRQKGHFERYQQAIIDSWEAISKIPYQGEIGVYLRWLARQGSK